MNWNFLKAVPWKKVGAFALDNADDATRMVAGPLAGTLVELAIAGVKKAATSGKSNEEKFADALQTLQSAAPMLDKMFPGVKPDDKHLSEGANHLVEAALAFTKAVGETPKVQNSGHNPALDPKRGNEPAPIQTTVFPPAIPALDGHLPVLSPIPAKVFVNGIPLNAEVTISISVEGA